MAHKAYGRAHQRTRTHLLPLAYGTPCPICNKPMQRWEPLDLGHSTHQLKQLGLPGDRIEHTSCNRADTGEPNTATRTAPMQSRTW